MNLFAKDSDDYFNIDTYHFILPLLSKTYDQGFECLYFESCKKPSHLFVFVQAMLRIYFNEFKVISDTIFDYIFNTIPIDNLTDARSFKQHYREKIKKISVRNSSVICKKFQLSVKADMIFRAFKPDADHTCPYFKITNNHYYNLSIFIRKVFILINCNLHKTGTKK